MAITLAHNRVGWNGTGTDTDDVAADSAVTSDVFTLDATCVAAQIHLRAEQVTGAAAIDDQIAFYIQQTGGDTDGDVGGDEYDTTDHSIFLALLDCSADDPARATVPIPIPQKSFRIYATGISTEGGGGNTNTIEVSAMVTEQRAA